ncbi:MAG TPA: carboxypeptidase regulatory-like domain-containing protein [Candidatus Limnocylindria bacterium]|nr:carboxypeptidase regulatory-like domain-containing protein [Candidatus Limnocylindria bacterium]
MRRKTLGAFVAVALVAGAAAFVSLPGFATAQGGGTIEAEVKYNGAPVVETLKINKDTQACGTEAKIEKVAVGANKGLAHAVVSVAGAKGEATAKKAVIDQKGCKFVPHVVAMTPGEIDILNSDNILHNVHTYSTANPAINKAQPRFKKTMTEKFDKPEIIKITCDVHSWMLGWIAVMPHPFFGVTDGNGTTKIANVPPGKHTVEVWHETLGKQTKGVEVKAGQTAKVSFEMKGK